MSESPADILRRLRPIPTYVDRPTTTPHDVVGVGVDGGPCRVEVEQEPAPVVLLFLSSGCLGCRDLWEGLAALDEGLGGAAHLAVVTRDPGEEDPAAIAALAAGGTNSPRVRVVMSSAAFRDYRVAGPPFVVVAEAEAVRTESVAWGLDQTLRTCLDAVRSG